MNTSYFIGVRMSYLIFLCAGSLYAACLEITTSKIQLSGVYATTMLTLDFHRPLRTDKERIVFSAM